LRGDEERARIQFATELLAAASEALPAWRFANRRGHAKSKRSDVSK
jgi:hypothetical protein